MRRKGVRLLAAVTAALCVAIGSTIGARAFSIPAMVPDICAFGSCVQFTQTNALASIQQLEAQINTLNGVNAQVAQMKVNSQTMTGMWPAMNSDVNAIKAAYTSTASGAHAAAAADAYTNEEAEDEAFFEELEAETNSAQGSTQQAQLTNRYLATVDEDLKKNGELTAAQMNEQTDEKIGDSANMFGLLNSSSTNSSHISF